MTNGETTKPRANREIDWRQLIETALDTPGSVGNTYNRFYNYSFLNQMYLRLQGVTEPVATYRRWQQVGRQVLRGSKAKEIVQPVIIERKNDNGGGESKKVLFKLVRCIFALSDTDGPDLPPVDPPGWDLPTALDALDVRQLPFAELNGNVQGYSHDRYYAINPVAADPTSTTFHELGHILLRHTIPERMAEYGTHRGIFEFQAEATSFLTMNELEVITPEQASESRGYIQGWLRDDRPDDLAIRQVFTATDRILKAGRAAIEQPDDPRQAG